MKLDDLVSAVATKLGVTKVKAREYIDAVVDTIKDVAEQDDVGIKLQGLGTFRYKTRPERKGRNPQTGAEITIPAKTVLTFKAVKG